MSRPEIRLTVKSTKMKEQRKALARHLRYCGNVWGVDTDDYTLFHC